MYSMCGTIPGEAAEIASFRKAILEHNCMTPHWQFAERDGDLHLRYCRQADLLDSSEVIHAVEDLRFIIRKVLDD
jgi:hypothetical protein